MAGGVREVEGDAGELGRTALRDQGAAIEGDHGAVHGKALAGAGGVSVGLHAGAVVFDDDFQAVTPMHPQGEA